MSRSIAIIAMAAALSLPYPPGGQNGYYAIVGSGDREISPTVPAPPWPDALCHHDARNALSVCERGLP